MVHGCLLAIIFISLTHLSGHTPFPLDFQPTSLANGSSYGCSPLASQQMPHSPFCDLSPKIWSTLSPTHLRRLSTIFFFSRMISPSLSLGKTESSTVRLVSFCQLLISRCHNQGWECYQISYKPLFHSLNFDMWYQWVVFLFGGNSLTSHSFGLWATYQQRLLTLLPALKW